MAWCVCVCVCVRACVRACVHACACVCVCVCVCVVAWHACLFVWGGCDGVVLMDIGVSSVFCGECAVSCGCGTVVTPPDQT